MAVKIALYVDPGSILLMLIVDDRPMVEDGDADRLDAPSQPKLGDFASPTVGVSDVKWRDAPPQP